MLKELRRKLELCNTIVKPFYWTQTGLGSRHQFKWFIHSNCSDNMHLIQRLGTVLKRVTQSDALGHHSILWLSCMRCVKCNETNKAEKDCMVGDVKAFRVVWRIKSSPFEGNLSKTVISLELKCQQMETTQKEQRPIIVTNFKHQHKWNNILYEKIQSVSIKFTCPYGVPLRTKSSKRVYPILNAHK